MTLMRTDASSFGTQELEVMVTGMSSISYSNLGYIACKFMLHIRVKIENLILIYEVSIFLIVEYHLIVSDLKQAIWYSQKIFN